MGCCLNDCTLAKCGDDFLRWTWVMTTVMREATRELEGGDGCSAVENEVQPFVVMGCSAGEECDDANEAGMVVVRVA